MERRRFHASILPIDLGMERLLLSEATVELGSGPGLELGVPGGGGGVILPTNGGHLTRRFHRLERERGLVANR